MTAEEAYRILGVPPGADAKEVQQAYRRKALALHPDRAASPEEAQSFYRGFLEVRDAYEKLRREGFPVPEPESVAPEVSPSSWTAGRSFAPKEERKDWTFSQTMGFEFRLDLNSVFLWLVLIPGGALAVVYFVKFILKAVSGGGGA